jgi:glycosyltransferase involved in cell wall biosynthesis
LRKPRLGIVMTHPVRYIIPLVQLLTKQGKIDIKVFFTYGPELMDLPKYTKTYRDENEQELPLFEGYNYEFVGNIAKRKSISTYYGINNPGLIKKVREWGPDAILVSGWNKRSHFRIMRHFKGKIPVHFRGDSTLLDEPSFSFFKRVIRGLALSLIYRYIDMAWYVGTNNKNYFLKMGVPPQKLFYIPHCVDNNRFRRTNAMAVQALMYRKELNISSEATVFLFAGRFKKKKGVFTLITAFIQSAAKNAHLLFVGTGPALTQMKQMAYDTPNIHFLPPQTQTKMPYIYSIGDVLVLPSESDTWGLVMNEAMANGLAIVSTYNSGGAIDLIDEGRNGHIFNAGNTNQLSTIITDISSDRVKLKKMQDHSKVKINDFSYDIAAEKIEMMLSDIVKETQI